MVHEALHRLSLTSLAYRIFHSTSLQFILQWLHCLQFPWTGSFLLAFAQATLGLEDSPQTPSWIPNGVTSGWLTHPDLQGHFYALAQKSHTPGNFPPQSPPSLSLPRPSLPWSGAPSAAVGPVFCHRTLWHCYRLPCPDLPFGSELLKSRDCNYLFSPFCIPCSTAGRTQKALNREKGRKEGGKKDGTKIRTKDRRYITLKTCCWTQTDKTVMNSQPP